MKMYYTDALYTVIMMRDFGVRIMWDDKRDWGIDDIALWAFNWYQEINHPALVEPKKFHIHPESYQIFEPQEGDLIEYFDGQHKRSHDCYYIRLSNSDVGYYMETSVGNVFQPCFRKIIQRDGKAFFEPVRGE